MVGNLERGSLDLPAALLEPPQPLLQPTRGEKPSKILNGFTKREVCRSYF